MENDKYYYRNAAHDFLAELRDALQITLDECFPQWRKDHPAHVNIRAEMLEVNKEFDPIREVLEGLIEVLNNVIKREFPDNYQ